MAEGAEGRLAHCKRQHKTGRSSENHRGARRLCALAVRGNVGVDATAAHPQSAHQLSLGLRMQAEDPDGNVLRFGSDPKKDEPFGPFMDMHGQLGRR